MNAPAPFRTIKARLEEFSVETPEALELLLKNISDIGNDKTVRVLWSITPVYFYHDKQRCFYLKVAVYEVKRQWA